MRDGFQNIAVVIEKQNLDTTLAQDGIVVNHDASHAVVNPDELEMKVWNFLQSAFPIGARGFFASEGASRLAHHLRDERGRHLKVVSIVRKNAIEIMSIPCRDPFRGDSMSRHFVQGELFHTAICSTGCKSRLSDLTAGPHRL
jgi:hypothetical protein